VEGRNSSSVHPMVALADAEEAIALLPCHNMRSSSIRAPAHHLALGEHARIGQRHLRIDQPKQHRAEEATGLEPRMEHNHLALQLRIAKTQHAQQESHEGNALRATTTWIL
jgi:hypothetical protein